MSVAVHYSKENDRFVRHQFLSLSPTSTTIYSRSFDLKTGKYHVPVRVNEETGEINEIKPPVFRQHIGSLSDKARRQLNRSVLTLLGLVDEKILIDGENKEKITFSTFTLPSSQIKTITEHGIEYYATDKQIKHDCFNQLLTELRTTQNITHYVWVCEKQLNGSIHFHLLLDQRVDWEYLRRRWNSLINKYGFVDRYQSKMQKLTYSQYVKLRTKDYKKEITKEDFEAIKKAWDFGQRTNWTQPNSTDIEPLHNVDNVGAYISKYMSKGYSHTSDEQKEYISKLAGNIEINNETAKNFYQIDGRIWQCSQTVSKARKCIVEAEDYFIEEINYLTDSIKNLKVFVEDRYTTVLHKFINIYTHCYNIYQHYANHLKAHSYDSIRDIICSTYDYSPCHLLSPILGETSISPVVQVPTQKTNPIQKLITF